jgi:hypothetical protein
MCRCECAYPFSAVQRVEVGDHVVELNGVAVAPVLGFTRQGKDYVTAAADDQEAAAAAAEGAPGTPEGYMVGGISMDVSSAPIARHT